MACDPTRHASDLMTVGSWADRIKVEVGKTVNSVLAIGRLLIAAKAALDHGMFETLFFDLPFDLRAGEMYMKVAANEVLANPKHVSLLPPAVSTLYRLSCLRIPLRDLEAAVMDGRIHPKLQRNEVQSLLSAPPPTPEWSPDAFKDLLRPQINRQVKDAPPGSHPSISSALRELADEVDEADDPQLYEAATIAKDDLDLHDYEPGGQRFYESAEEAATHPGSPHVVASCKSTHQPWYRGLTTKVEGITPLRRNQIDACIDDIRVGKLPTKRTWRILFAVRWAIQHLGRGGEAP